MFDIDTEIEAVRDLMQRYVKNMDNYDKDETYETAYERSNQVLGEFYCWLIQQTQAYKDTEAMLNNHTAIMKNIQTEQRALFQWVKEEE